MVHQTSWLLSPEIKEGRVTYLSMKEKGFLGGPFSLTSELAESFGFKILN